MNVAADAFWRIPSSFGAARLLGPSYSLRCVVFHNILAKQPLLTGGIEVIN